MTNSKLTIEHLQDLKTRALSVMVRCNGSDDDEFDLHQAAYTFMEALDHAIAIFSQRKLKEKKEV